ncbi:DUF2867 domain-containing protein [Flavobacterium cerinum]|uniref:DUF2867 domain-containing protein n=1 Tax=Flavobacterium cerinum TaxID=2502784 RepID=A0ABY5IR40_9FLAO|nr:DUF2867 domain-containing protein [Flavobacterium cerinum]UUC45104.1 DUF2867 domain-containing protein [Flavobacterium cerinum]
MKVIEEHVDLSEKALKSLVKIDFSDTFSTTNHQDSIAEITRKIFGQSPVWIRTLFTIRNFLVRLIGLKNEKPSDYNVGLAVGQYIGFFKVFSVDKTEILLGADDTHLNFRALIQNTSTANYNIKVTTLVAYNNQKGRYYMRFILPFHRIVVKSMVRQAYQN